MIGKTNALTTSVDSSAVWFGDGSDGDLTVAANQTVQLPVVSDEGQIIKNYNNLTIESGGLLTAANRCNGMILLVSGDLTVNGSISMDKKAPLLNSAETTCAEEEHIKLCGTLIGGNGGAGGSGGQNANAATGNYGNVSSGGIGGNGFPFGGGYGGGGGAASYYYVCEAGAAEPRPPIGTQIPYPAPAINATNSNSLYGAGAGCYVNNKIECQGGNGPGGGGAAKMTGSSGYSGTAGEAVGGGGLWIFAKGKVTVGTNGRITANGGNGGRGGGLLETNGGSSSVYYANGGGGGGAGGGIVCVITSSSIVENSGTIVANGGLGAQGGHSGFSSHYGANGADGSAGTVLIATISQLITV